MPDNPQNYFPNLNPTELQSHALDWAAEYPNIQRIFLYKGFRMEDVPKYVIVVSAAPVEPYPFFNPDYFPYDDLDFLELLAEMKHEDRVEVLEPYKENVVRMIDYFNWSDTACLHIRDDLDEFYRENPPPENYRAEWMWFNIEPGEDIDDYDMVHPEHYWVLYPAEEHELDTGQRPAKKYRFDRMRIEIETILKTLPKEKHTATCVMTELRNRAGKDYSCVIESTDTGVAWQGSTGRKDLDFENLGKRLKRLAKG